MSNFKQDFQRFILFSYDLLFLFYFYSSTSIPFFFYLILFSLLNLFSSSLSIVYHLFNFFPLLRSFFLSLSPFLFFFFVFHRHYILFTFLSSFLYIASLFLSLSSFLSLSLYNFLSVHSFFILFMSIRSQCISDCYCYYGLLNIVLMFNQESINLYTNVS